MPSKDARMNRAGFPGVTAKSELPLKTAPVGDCGFEERIVTIAAAFIKPNDRLSSFERLEIYNCQYWFRVLDCLYDDYPGSWAKGSS